MGVGSGGDLPKREKFATTGAKKFATAASVEDCRSPEFLDRPPPPCKRAVSTLGRAIHGPPLIVLASPQAALAGSRHGNPF